MAQVGIVYGNKSAAIRRIIIPDNDSELQHHKTVPGEAMILIDRDSVPTGNAVQALAFFKSSVKNATGIDPPDPRCAVVDTITGLVVTNIMADPNLDDHPDGHIIFDDKASPGWCLLTNGDFVNPNEPVLDDTGKQIGIKGIPIGVQVAGDFVFAPPLGVSVIDSGVSVVSSGPDSSGPVVER